jgi:hypothetical protein
MFIQEHMKRIIIGVSLIFLIILTGCNQKEELTVGLSDCKTYFDGCNTCSVVDGKIDGCTEKACESIDGSSAYKETECLEYY